MKRIKASNLPAALATQKQLPVYSTETIQNLILLCADLFHEELTQAKVKFWKDLLAPLPVAGVEYAFDQWNRNGDFFPKPKDITQLVAMWRESNDAAVKTCGKCQNGWVIVNPQAKTCDQKAKRCDCILSQI